VSLEIILERGEGTCGVPCAEGIRREAGFHHRARGDHGERTDLDAGIDDRAGADMSRVVDRDRSHAGGADQSSRIGFVGEKHHLRTQAAPAPDPYEVAVLFVDKGRVGKVSVLADLEACGPQPIQTTGGELKGDLIAVCCEAALESHDHESWELGRYETKIRKGLYIMAQDSGSQSRETSAELLKGAFRRALGLSDDIPTEKIVRGVLPQWDSIGHMEVVAEIEQTFGIRMTDDDVLNLESFDQALDVVHAASSAGTK
jgi:acyl carrier protein